MWKSYIYPSRLLPFPRGQKPDPDDSPGFELSILKRAHRLTPTGPVDVRALCAAIPPYEGTLDSLYDHQALERLMLEAIKSHKDSHNYAALVALITDPTINDRLTFSVANELIAALPDEHLQSLGTEDLRWLFKRADRSPNFSWCPFTACNLTQRVLSPLNDMGTCSTTRLKLLLEHAPQGARRLNDPFLIREQKYGPTTTQLFASPLLLTLCPKSFNAGLGQGSSLSLPDTERPDLAELLLKAGADPLSATATLCEWVDHQGTSTESASSDRKRIASKTLLELLMPNSPTDLMVQPYVQNRYNLLTSKQIQPGLTPLGLQRLTQAHNYLVSRKLINP